MINLNLRWDEPLLGLWLQSMTPSRRCLSDRTDGGHLNKDCHESESLSRSGASYSLEGFRKGARILEFGEHKASFTQNLKSVHGMEVAVEKRQPK